VSAWQYVCERCGHEEPASSRDWRCPSCGGAFRLDVIEQLDRAQIVSDDPTLWRYQAVLPADRSTLRSLGEGMTPIVAGTLGGRDVWFKLDALLPTGSFKDRGAAVLVAHLRSLGLNRIVVDSSGNAAAAMAGYCSANGIECSVFAPATTSPGKLVQARAFGASVTLVEGNREAVAAAAQDAAESDPSAFYGSHNWHPVFAEGVKTWALEVWEQLGFHVPTAVFVPTGGGSAFVGARLGFDATGEPLPLLIAAQPDTSAPIVAAYNAGLDDIEPVTPGATIAEGTRIGAPARGIQIMSALKDSSGWAQAVSEEQIRAALRQLWQQGLYVEPTAAVGAAALLDALEHGHALPDGDIVVLLTGSGLKATETIAGLLDYTHR
jgi:threonine synthase